MRYSMRLLPILLIGIACLLTLTETATVSKPGEKKKTKWLKKIFKRNPKDKAAGLEKAKSKKDKKAAKKKATIITTTTTTTTSPGTRVERELADDSPSDDTTTDDAVTDTSTSMVGKKKKRLARLKAKLNPKRLARLKAKLTRKRKGRKKSKREVKGDMMTKMTSTSTDTGSVSLLVPADEIVGDIRSLCDAAKVQMERVTPAKETATKKKRKVKRVGRMFRGLGKKIKQRLTSGRRAGINEKRELKKKLKICAQLDKVIDRIGKTKSEKALNKLRKALRKLQGPTADLRSEQMSSLGTVQHSSVAAVQSKRMPTKKETSSLNDDYEELIKEARMSIST